jgi:hypothetical protein
MKAYWGVEVWLHAFFDLSTYILLSAHVLPVFVRILQQYWRCCPEQPLECKVKGNVPAHDNVPGMKMCLLLNLGYFNHYCQN